MCRRTLTSSRKEHILTFSSCFSGSFCCDDLENWFVQPGLHETCSPPKRNSTLLILCLQRKQIKPVFKCCGKRLYWDTRSGFTLFIWVCFATVFILYTFPKVIPQKNTCWDFKIWLECQSWSIAIFMNTGWATFVKTDWILKGVNETDCCLCETSRGITY